MPHEITPWKAPGCTLTVAMNHFSQRAGYSREINQTYGEGGALNADYRAFEAGMIIANILGKRLGMEYGVHFVFKTTGFNGIYLDFCDELSRNAAETVLAETVLMR